MFILMKERVTQSSGVAHWYVFNSFWETTERYRGDEFQLRSSG